MTASAASLPEPPCWKRVGIAGDRSCEELVEQVHCRNCPRYREGGRELLDRPMPPAYRAELTRHLARPPDREEGAQRRLMVFRVGAIWLALPAACFEETFSPVPVTRVPLRSNRHFMGLVNLHGELQLCFTLSHWLHSDDDESAAADRSTVRVFPRMMGVRLRGERWVFPVDEVRGMVDTPLSELEPLPANLERFPQRLVTRLIPDSQGSVKLLDGERLAELFLEALA